MYKKIFLLILFLLITSCKNKNEASENSDIELAKNIDKIQVYVEPNWVKSVIDGNQPQSSNYVILEASWGEPSSDYKKSHIQGALHINTDLIEEPKYWNIRTPEEIEQVMKDFGISKNTTVIIYGAPSPAARVAITLLWAGVDEVHILDGGLKSWINAGYKTSNNTEKASPIEDQKIWSEWSVSKENEISFYCGTGWRASIPFLIAYQNGWTNISLYDGGWYVWQMNSKLPIQLGNPTEITNK